MPDFYLGYGKDIPALISKLLECAEIKSRLPNAAKVVIKPNLVKAADPEQGATTHAEIVDALIVYLKAHCSPAAITIAEGAWLGAQTTRAFSVCGYDALARKHGVKLVDTKRDKTMRVHSHGLNLEICQTFLETDYFINIPVLKGHCQTLMTCCIKNLKGCIPDSEKSRYHSIGLDKPIAALGAALRPDLHIVDSICGDPTFEEGGNPLRTDRIIMGFDPVLLDSYGAGLIGLDYREVEYLRLAEEWGVGKFVSDSPDFVEIGGENRPATIPTRSRIASKLAGHIEESGACSACYAALIAALNKRGGGLRGEKIKIGQGFRGKKPGGVGVGRCTSGCERHLPGCPPKAVDILEFLDG